MTETIEYKLKNNCHNENCHPETCNCSAYAIFKGDQKYLTLNDKEVAEHVTESLNFFERKN